MTKQTETLVIIGGLAAIAYYISKGSPAMDTFLKGTTATVPSIGKNGEIVNTPVASGNYLMVGDGNGDPICPKAGPLRCGKWAGQIALRPVAKTLHAMGTLYQGMGNGILGA